jgi:hypothetical protein
MNRIRGYPQKRSPREGPSSEAIIQGGRDTIFFQKVHSKKTLLNQ